jgi:hypothetical protein
MLSWLSRQRALVVFGLLFSYPVVAQEVPPPSLGGAAESPKATEATAPTTEEGGEFGHTSSTVPCAYLETLMVVPIRLYKAWSQAPR